MDESDLVLWSLAAVRIWALLRAQVLWRAVVGPSWWLVAAGLAALLAPVASRHMGPVPDQPLIALAFVELAVGTVLGLVATLPGHALIGAAQTAEATLGLGLVGSTTLSRVCIHLSLAIALTLGLHVPLLTSLAATFELWPQGALVGAVSASAVIPTVVHAAHAMTVLALALATPVLLAALVTDVCVRLVGSGGDPGSVVASGALPWLRTAAALIALGASWAAYPGAWAAAIG